MSQERPETPTRSQGNTPSVSPFDSPNVSARNSADEEVDCSRLSRCSFSSKLHAEPSIFFGVAQRLTNCCWPLSWLRSIVKLCCWHLRFQLPVSTQSPSSMSLHVSL